MNLEPQRSLGFTLIELLVVITVMSILAGTMVPLATATQKAERLTRAQKELDAIGEAMEAYYYDNASFPAALNASTFYGIYILPGVGDEKLEDEWGGNGFYKLSQTSNPDILIVYSVGPDGVDGGASSESLKVTIQGANPGLTKTRERLRVIAAALAEYLSGGGTLTGTWTTDLAAMGLGTAYQKDGFGSDFTLNATSRVLTSAGPDRSFGTSDDVVF